MSILVNKDTRMVIQGGAAGVNAARRMAEFCYLIKRPLSVEAFVYPPDAGKTNEIPFGSGLWLFQCTEQSPRLPRTILRSIRVWCISALIGPWRVVSRH